MTTEQQNPHTANIDQLPTSEILERINAEDARVAEVVNDALPNITQAVDAIAEKLTLGGRLIYIGAGTSGRLGVLDAAECVPTFGILSSMIVGIIAGGEKAMVNAVEGAEDNRQAAVADLVALKLSSSDAVVGIAASGRTPYVLAAVEYAKTIGALAVGISCNVPAPLLDMAEIQIGVPVGPEVITGSTRMKAGTAQKLVLNMLSTATMVKLGKVYGNLMVDVQITNAKLALRAGRIVAQITGLDENAAMALLAQAGNRVKIAVVMNKHSISREEAQTLLNAANGYLRKAIETESSPKNES
jgi:N-acetylmuramic acid 6-phosphate etherase